MKRLDEKMEAVEKKLSKLASDVVRVGAAGTSLGAQGLQANPLQQAFGSLGLGANVIGGEELQPQPQPQV